MPDYAPILEQPRKRSSLRKILGREFYTLKRTVQWRTGGIKWAHTRTRDRLPVELIAHRSFLLRKLKDVDMYLQHNKVVNLARAIEKIDGLIIYPGQTFSVWKNVGRPTARKGYLEGLVLENGQVGKGVGGGLCQLGNLLYWMALHSPLQVTERWRHGYDVFPDVNRTLPFGSGATLAYNYVDLQLFNPSDQPFQISLWLSQTHLHGSIISERPVGLRYEVFETDHQFRFQWWGGYTRHNRIWRKVYDETSGEERVEFVTENHAVMMYEPLLPEHSSV